MIIDRNLSYSQMDCFESCRRRWWYQYFQGYKPKIGKTDYMRGSLLHFGMEYGIRSSLGEVFDAGSPWDQALVSWKGQWNYDENGFVVEPNWFDNCKKVVDGALVAFLDHWDVCWDQNEPLIERRMYLDLPSWYRGVVCIPDVVGTKKQEPFKNGIFSVDFKSYSKPRPVEAADFDLQGAIYQKCLQTRGYPAIGSCTFQLGMPPKPPRYKKDGEVYANDAAAIANWKAVVNAEPTCRSDDYIDGLWEEVILPIAQNMHWLEEWGQNMPIISSCRPHVNNFACSWCDFKLPCQAHLRRQDEADILRESYTTREQREQQRREHAEKEE